MTTYIYKDELYHHGIKGQRWGKRNYQYEDGSLTPAGRARYSVGEKKKEIRSNYKNDVKLAKENRRLRDKKIQEDYDKGIEEIERNYRKNGILTKDDLKKEEELDKRATSAWEKSKNDYKNEVAQFKANKNKAINDLKNSDEYKALKSDRRKKMAVGAAVVGTAVLAVYGAKKISELKKQDHESKEALNKVLSNLNEGTKHINSAKAEYEKTLNEYHSVRDRRDEEGKWLRDYNSGRLDAQGDMLKVLNKRQNAYKTELDSIKKRRSKNIYSVIRDKYGKTDEQKRSEIRDRNMKLARLTAKRKRHN